MNARGAAHAAHHVPSAVAAVGIGIGVAAVAGLAAGALTGAGLLTMSGAATAGRRGAKPPLKAADVKWHEEGRVESWHFIIRGIQQGGLEPEARAALWPHLLGVFPLSSTQAERDVELERLRRLYTKLVLVCQELDNQITAMRSGRYTDGSSSPSTVASASPDGTANGGACLAVDNSQRPAGHSSPSGSARGPLLPGNLAAFAEAHRIIVMDAVRTDIQRIAQGGPIGGGPPSPTLTILPVSVGDGLPELMLVNAGAPPEPASPAAAVAAGEVPMWRSPLADETLRSAAHLNAHTRRQMLRLVNLLSAYAVHDPETGYCQGMSDLAAIFVQLLPDDALAFACFERLMRSARRNFKHDETGIKHQLSQVGRIVRDTDPALHRKLVALEAQDCMFAYRMVVVMLRRELPPGECCTLWEIQWALEAGVAAEEATAASAAGTAGLARTEFISRTNSDGSTTVGMAAAAGVSSTAALKCTTKSMSDATACAAQDACTSPTAGTGTGVARPGSGSSSRRPIRVASSNSLREEEPEFMLQFIAAVVRSQRGRILTECHEHDDILRLFNSVRIDFWLALAQARKQWRAYRQGSVVMQRL